MLSPVRSAWCTKKLNSTGTLIQRTTTEAPQGHMYYIGLDVHKKTISYYVKDASGQVHQEGQIGATRRELDGWMKTLPQPWTVRWKQRFSPACLCVSCGEMSSKARSVRSKHRLRAASTFSCMHL